MGFPRQPLIALSGLLFSSIAIFWFALGAFYYHLPDGLVSDILGSLHLMTLELYWLFGLTGIFGFGLSCWAFMR